MSRHRDKRAAVVLGLLLVLAFVFGQVRRADADRHATAGAPPSGGLVAEGAASVIHD
ncbi:MAG: hypothetical protein IPK64_14490 [bacterium]|nr:hypothetical protein [bacterium]